MAGMLVRKMLRDMKAAATAYFLCMLVVAMGLCGYSVLKLCYDNLTLSRDLFYHESDYCGGIADTVYTDPSAAGRLEDIPGIARAQGRLVQDVQAGDGVELHLVSWRKGQMNRPVLSRGTMPGDGKPELVIGEGMAKARGLKPGDTIPVASGGKLTEMKITGIGMTPENIYMVRSQNELFPDPSTYDAAFASPATVAWLSGRQGSVNSFLIRLEPGTEFAQVSSQVERALTPYGFLRAYAGGDQTGAAMLNEEIKQLDKMAGVVPLLFLTVAGVVLAITLSRMVEQQRAQIGTMMALGIPGRVVRLHYMGYGATVGGAGGVLGTLLGYMLAGPMADFYRVYFNLPSVTAPLPAEYLVVGTVAAGLFSAGISWGIAGAAGRLAPAAALRPAAPREARRSVLERIPGFVRLLTVPGIMAVRSLSRNRKRTACSLAGMAVAYMLTATMLSMNTMFDLFIFDYWEKTQRQDIMVYFDRPVEMADALETVRHPKAVAAEGMLEFPATLAGRWGKLDCTVQAFQPDTSMLRLYREDGSAVRVPGQGIVLSEHMAQKLGVGRGGYVEVRVTYPEKKETRMQVADVIAQYMGSSAYMSLESASTAGGYGEACSAVYIQAPEEALLDLRGRLKGEGAVSLVQSRTERLSQYRAMMGTMGGMVASMSLLGVGTGFAVVWVSSLVRYEEMKRELAALMLLGMDSRECLDVLSVGQWILAAGSVVLGIPMAAAVSRLMTAAMSGDLYTIPNMLSKGALLGAAGLTGVSVFLGTAVMLRRLGKIVPVQLVRDRE